MRDKSHLTQSAKFVGLLKDFLKGKGFIVRVRVNCGTPDEDFLFMSTARYFILGGGGFSRLAATMVRLNGGHDIIGNRPYCDYPTKLSVSSTSINKTASKAEATTENAKSKSKAKDTQIEGR